MQSGIKPTTTPTLRTPAQRALYNNLGKNEALALQLHESIVKYKPNGWRGIDTREKAVKQTIYKVLRSIDGTERIFEIVKNHQSIKMEQLHLNDITIDVVLKDIKNVHLVNPPSGRVRIAAPLRMSLDNIRIYAISKLGWIKNQQKKFLEQVRESPREFLYKEVE